MTKTIQVLYRREEVMNLISGMVDAILQDFDSFDDLIVTGIASGGIPLGHTLAHLLQIKTGISIPFGRLETSFHRDDIGRRPIPSISQPTDIPVPIDGKIVLLVDDVIASGRTIRAAMNELFDQGRPAAIKLAVLLDRGGRKLPVQPDFLATKIEAPADQRIKMVLNEEDSSSYEVHTVPATW